MSYVLGIDGGGSKTVCILMDDSCQVLGRGEAGPSNYQSIGIEVTLQSIQSAIYNAVEAAIITNTLNINAICLGLAGVGRAADIEVVKGLVKELQNNKLPINWALQPANIVICNDALIALVGGIGQPVGIVVAVGTGSIVFGRNHQGNTKRVGGWGYILGDEGSAYKIAIAGMNAALKSYDGREISTSLVEAFKQHLNLESIEDLIEVVYRRGWGVKQIAALAPIVDLAAASGDIVANIIIDDAVKELVKATSTLIDAIFSADSVLEVVTTGSVWRGRSNFHERFAASLVKKFPEVNVIFPRYEPAYGAGLLALQTTQI
ncbi:N-acetylglucosamine kinase [Nostoc sp. 'Lobaria pulmonaria (5183) cyanobiont']|uniref:N-acetylglucosamine kinase n=1 Tax=Nostoc sp. 'Lobaria pulmonaria (5183) cyanobiont' TaxID=1618022 RepID=UPI000CF323BA|nr:N-acetylglucosamine kinase [Nostoc sp. 'Lobaria pulmonaria (5183) cyanobiont']AVH70091.1 BadF/BadG/BcrA/BcrD type ATPase [Nostoc sp. 'Lobaria pulmonaria (5183) cyanobiont']